MYTSTYLAWHNLKGLYKVIVRATYDGYICERRVDIYMKRLLELELLALNSNYGPSWKGAIASKLVVFR